MKALSLIVLHSLLMVFRTRLGVTRIIVILSSSFTVIRKSSRRMVSPAITSWTRSENASFLENKTMKKFALLMLAAIALSGCVVEERGHHYHPYGWYR